MTKKTIFCVCLIMLLARCGYGANNLGDLDGNEWQEMEGIEKTVFIEGFLIGSNYVVEENKCEDMQLINRLTTESGKKVSEFDRGMAENEKIGNIILQRFSFYNITVGQIMEGLDILYKDFKNKGIKVSDAIYVVKRQIEGTSPVDIEKILIYLRSGKENFRALIIGEQTQDKIKDAEERHGKGVIKCFKDFITGKTTCMIVFP